MIGILYRYPHPYDPARFIYVGQGANRDKQHRAGRGSFGRRFKRYFPDIELPQPIKEQVEVQNYVELNELETIWMFRYHTWKGYKDGMNLVFPGSIDYKNAGKLGGPIGGRISGTLAAESGQLDSIRSKENSSKGGRISGRRAVETGQIQSLGRVQGRRNVESGHLASISSKGGSVGGLVSGRLAAESGQLASLRTPEHQSKAGKVSGRRNVENGHLASLRTPEHQSKAGRLGGQKVMHARFHINRNKPNPRCALCSEQNLIIAFS